MAFTTIDKSTDYFNTKLYTGNGSVGTALTTGTFQPDFCWFKNRGTVENHVLINAIRGASYNLASNLNRAETNVSDKVSAFTSTGVTLGSSAETNENNEPLVAWNWKANGQGSSNTAGSINSTYTSANTTAGCSIVNYTGTNATATVGHGLGVAPKMIIWKELGNSNDWCVWHTSLSATQILVLNTTGPVASDSNVMGTLPTSSVFSIGQGTRTNRSGGTYIAYCFADIQGYSKFGSYTGNNNADGPFIYTGFKPAFLLVRNTQIATEYWYMFDNKRLGYNPDNDQMVANAVGTDTGNRIDLYSNGFKPIQANSSVNNSQKFIYMAFAAEPLVSSNDVVATAR